MNAPAVIGMPLSAVETPALLIELDAFERNLHRDLKDVTVEMMDVIEAPLADETYEDLLDKMIRIRARLQSSLEEAAQRHPVPRSELLDSRGTADFCVAPFQSASPALVRSGHSSAAMQ